jgi:hypothetical protein
MHLREVDEPAPDTQTAQMPDVPRPDELDPTRWATMFERRFVPTRGEPGPLR